ncbi:hypothetical protein M2650_13640 [Luteimonas sp. SX5]|uniref:DUF2157 domain-containing protein n=1 Tax=Luteimonas galliterrae TaxID=2940486 RepID=A0ABT0MLB5_9GAMM|nr:hypothetical protein [Luteimonas galliterrae]MCL1635666.1 hypothetical protein [Luteimonas galliterrae]
MNINDKNRRNDAALLDEREWLAQEQALRDERLGIVSAGGDAPEAHYRTIVRVLREPPPESLPENFAHQVAGLAAARAAPARDATGFERLMLNLLGVALAMSGVVALAMYGNEAIAGVDERIVRWGLLLAVCAGLSWSLDVAWRLLGRDGRMHHA